MIIILLLIILVAFLYFQNSKNSQNLFVPLESEIFLATKNSKLQDFLPVDEDFKNIQGQKFFYIGSGKKVYGYEGKIFGSSGFYELEKNKDYNIQKNLKDFEDGKYDGFFVKKLLGENIFGTSSGNTLNIFFVGDGSGKIIFGKPANSDFFFSWGNMQNFDMTKKLEIFLESEYFSGMNLAEKSSLKKFFSYPGAINIFGTGWEAVSSFSGDGKFLTKLDSIGLKGNFFSGKNEEKIKFGNTDFNFGTLASEKTAKIFGSKRFFPYIFSGESNLEYGYQKFDIILE